jgi:hypothetical protein
MTDIRHFDKPVTIAKLVELFPNKVLAVERPEELSEAIDTTTEESRESLLNVPLRQHATRDRSAVPLRLKRGAGVAHVLGCGIPPNWSCCGLCSLSTEQGVSVVFNQQQPIRDLFEYISNDLFQKEIPVQNIVLKYSSSTMEISVLYPEEAKLQEKIETIVHLRLKRRSTCQSTSTSKIRNISTRSWWTTQ